MAKYKFNDKENVLQLPVYWYQVNEQSLDVVNIYTVKQMAAWFCCNMGSEARLGVIRLIKSEIVDVPLEVSKYKEVE